MVRGGAQGVRCGMWGGRDCVIGEVAKLWRQRLTFVGRAAAGDSSHTERGRQAVKRPISMLLPGPSNP